VTPDNPLAEFEIGSGAQQGSRLVLYANRLACQGGDSMETVPLAQLASVRVAFERDARKLNWAIGLLVVALLLLAASGPLHGWATSLAAGVKEHSGRESLDAVLLTSFSVIGGIARSLPVLATLLAALAAALATLFWMGMTTLSLNFGAVERSYAVRGRNPLLVQFAELVAAQLAARKG
jgi:hypothetical protein